MRIDDHCDWGAALTLFFSSSKCYHCSRSPFERMEVVFHPKKKKNKKLTFLNYPRKINGKKINFSNKSNDNLGSCKKMCCEQTFFHVYLSKKKKKILIET